MEDNKVASMEEDHTFYDTLLNVVGLNKHSINRLLGQDVASTSELSSMDDGLLNSCWIATTRPTAIKLKHLLAFKTWIQEQQAILGRLVSADPLDFTAAVLNGILTRNGTKQQDCPQIRGTNMNKDIKPPDPWHGKLIDWRKKQGIPSLPFKEA